MCLPTFLLWQETFKAEAVAGKSRRHQSRHECRCTGQCLNRYSGMNCLTRKVETGVAYTRSACVTDKSYGLSCLQTLHDSGSSAMLIEFMMGHQMVLDVEVFEQNTRRSRIFSQHQIGLFQHPNGA